MAARKRHFLSTWKHIEFATSQLDKDYLVLNLGDQVELLLRYWFWILSVLQSWKIPDCIITKDQVLCLYISTVPRYVAVNVIVGRLNTYSSPRKITS